MAKITSIVRNLKEIEELESIVDAFIIPIKDFSINYEKYFSLEELKKVNTNKEIFVSLNRNIHNSKLEELKELLVELNSFNIKGIIFYDISLVNLKRKLNLKYDLVWAQEHLTTNYSTINFWNSKGVNYAYLSSEITKDEINKIIENTNCKLFLNVFGRIPMFTSRRHLVNSYIETFKLKQSKNYSLFKENKIYPIDDTEIGTTVYSDYVLNFNEMIDVDYYVFNPYGIDFEEYKNVLKCYIEGKENKFPEELGFFNKETIYKVKKDV